MHLALARNYEYPTLSTIIVSDSNNLAELKEKVMGFNYGFAIAFENLSNKTIENTKKAMIEELKKKQKIYLLKLQYI